MNDQIIPVSFHGDTLALVDHDGEPFVAMKPMTENMGLDWTAQYKKLAERFGATIAVTAMVGEDGRQREMVCLPLRKLPAWLYSIVPSRVKPELREKIIRYQQECDDVLWKYWTQGYVERAGAQRPNIGQLVAIHREVRKLMQELKREGVPAIRRVLHAQLEQACRVVAIAPPALNEIGRDTNPDVVPPSVAAFWDAVDLIGLEKLNHSRAPGLLAINLNHFMKLCGDMGLFVANKAELRSALRRSVAPAFLTVKNVNSGLFQQTVKCWVFNEGEHDVG